MNITNEGILCAYAETKFYESEKAVEIHHLKVKFGEEEFEWPTQVGLVDLLHVGDTYDFHLAFPYDAWMRSACKDAMGCKIGQRLFVKCLQLFLIDNHLIEVEDRKEFRQFLKDTI